MCRKLALTATTVIAASLSLVALATQAQTTQTSAPMSMTTTSVTTTAPTPKAGAATQTAAPAPARPPRRKATPEERIAAERLIPLARAAFWAREADVDPTDLVAGVKLASALRALGQYQESAEASQRVLVLAPDNVDALLENARAYIGEGQGFYAIAPAEHLRALAPKDWRPVSLLGVAYAQTRRGDDAMAAWRQALILSPDNPAVLANMAMELAARGDAPQAETLLRRAVAQPGASLQVRQDLTLILGIQGKLAEAEHLLRMDLPPDQADADLAYLQAVSTGAAAPAPTAAVAPTRTWNGVKGSGG